MKKLALLFGLLFVTSAYAADNAVIVTPGTGVTMKSKDVGAGVQAMQPILSDTSGNSIYGTAGTANANILSVQGIASMTPILATVSQATGTNLHAVLDTTSTTAVTQATGTNLHAVLDTTSTTAVTQATGTNLHSVVDSGTITTVSTVTNLAQMNGAALLMGNGVTGTGSQRVTIASDNTAFAVNAAATLSAETTKVIGTVRNLGNAGGVLDAIGQNVAAPANWLQIGCQFTTSPTTITTGNGSPLSCANDNSLRVTIVAGAGSGGTALADGGTFTEASTSFTPVGGEYVSGGGANCTTGKGCTLQMTIDRAAYTNSYKWAGGVLGAMANYGTSPGAVLVPGVNAFVTNSNANGSATSANSSPVVIASDQVAVAVKAASGTIASGAIASGAVASGAYASGSIGSGAVASGAFASGALASGSIASGAMVDLLTMQGTKAAGTAAANSMLTGAIFNTTAPTLTDGQQAALHVSARGGLLLGNGYPAGSTPITISGTGTTAATTATLATGASVTTYICGFSIRANATAAVTNNATVTGTITGTLNYTQWTAPNASGLGVTEQIFTPCIPASAVNTGIAVVSGAPGTGGVVSVTAWGYTL